MDQELRFKQWLINWQPKNVTVNFGKNVWKEETLIAYTDALKNITSDLNIDENKIKKNLFDYVNTRKYLIAYEKIVNHPNFKSLKYYPIAKKALTRYKDFLFDSKKESEIKYS
ncbi:MAG: hypothetical protein CVV58_04950 [Tenericutes bacterium HGW-Tenericutes-3]|nr:MAG: hypothetical protein CVV58_04950 [Tenericutes bacterium HGW-Tenericutes-3]